ncbi:MAG: carbamate kinase [Solirubrobacterales bacterium]|nr:carbamate kinase [Solirubrobacterales bacterium]
MPRAVIALGGNALLPRGAPPEARTQARAARVAAGLLARVSRTHRLIVTHGNGPQVGLLALMSDAYSQTAPYPLDVLDSETEGQIGYVLELELDNAMSKQETVALLTRVVVAAADPAFSAPSKFIGPIYEESAARALAKRHGWTVKRDGQSWRRVVPSPEPERIVELSAIERLVDAGFVVVCAGGGGIPVVEDRDGCQLGVEAVVDKDLASALLAIDLGVDTLVLATDVDAVYDEFGTPAQRAIARATPAGLRSHRFAPGSMAPKVEAVCRFVERTGGRGVIGSLNEIDELLGGQAGTQVLPNGPELGYQERKATNDRAA